MWSPWKDKEEEQNTELCDVYRAAPLRGSSLRVCDRSCIINCDYDRKAAVKPGALQYGQERSLEYEVFFVEYSYGKYLHR